MASKYFEKSRFVVVFVVFSQLMVSECVPLHNGTNLRKVEAQINENKGKVSLLWLINIRELLAAWLEFQIICYFACWPFIF